MISTGIPIRYKWAPAIVGLALVSVVESLVVGRWCSSLKLVAKRLNLDTEAESGVTSCIIDTKNPASRPVIYKV